MKTLLRLQTIRNLQKRAAESELAAVIAREDRCAVRLVQLQRQQASASGSMVAALCVGDSDSMSMAQLDYAQAGAARPGTTRLLLDTGRERITAQQHYLDAAIKSRIFEQVMKDEQSKKQHYAERAEQKTLDDAYLMRRQWSSAQQAIAAAKKQ